MEHGNRFVHGDANRCPEYRTWRHMKSRCLNPNVPEYRYDGARGITISPRWLDSYEAFLADVGRRPGPDYRLERIDNDGNYEPGNCRWATIKEQSRIRRSNHMVTCDRRSQSIAAWAEELGIKFHTLKNRVRRGWSIERAFQRANNTRRR